MNMINSASRVFGTLMCVVGFTSSAYAGPYSLTVIPAISATFAFSEGGVVNENGQVAGITRVGSTFHAFFWDASSGIRDLGVLTGDTYSSAYGINNSGQVIGYSSNGITETAFIWDSITGMQSLGMLSGDIGSVAYGINNSGDVVGISRGADFQNHAFLWNASVGMNSIADRLGGASSTLALGINDHGQIIGQASSTPALLWDSNAGLRAIAGLPADFRNSYPLALNNNGEVVGYGSFDSEILSFFWNPVTGAKPIEGGSAKDINDSGQVVGHLNNGSAFLWTANSGLVDLNSLIDATTFVLIQAQSISNSGFIVGTGQDSFTGETRAFLLTPNRNESPLPQTVLPSGHAILYFGLGLLVLLTRSVNFGSWMA